MRPELGAGWGAGPESRVDALRVGTPAPPPRDRPAVSERAGMDERPAGRLDGDSLERLCGQGRELLRRAQSGAGRWGPPGQEVEGERMNLDTAFATMVEYMDYVSSQCGKFHVLEKAALNHICRYHQRQLNSISPPQVRQKKSASYEPRESYQVPMTDQGPTKIGATPYRVDSGPLEFGPRPSRSGSGPTEFDPRTSRIDPGPSKFVSRPSKSVFPGVWKPAASV